MCKCELKTSDKVGNTQLLMELVTVFDAKLHGEFWGRLNGGEMDEIPEQKENLNHRGCCETLLDCGLNPPTGELVLKKAVEKLE